MQVCEEGGRERERERGREGEREREREGGREGRREGQRQRGSGKEGRRGSKLGSVYIYQDAPELRTPLTSGRCPGSQLGRIMNKTTSETRTRH